MTMHSEPSISSPPRRLARPPGGTPGCAGRRPVRPRSWPRSPWPPAVRRPPPRPPRPPPPASPDRRAVGGRPAALPPGASGTIAAINGTSLEVQNPTTGQTTVTYTPTTTFDQTVTGHGVGVTVGSCISAFGKPTSSSSYHIGLRRPGDGHHGVRLPADLGHLHRRVRRRRWLSGGGDRDRRPRVAGSPGGGRPAGAGGAGGSPGQFGAAPARSPR